MSRILIGSVPIHGHVTPLLAVAAGLVDRGNRVSFVTGARFAGAVEGTGAEFTALPPEADFDDRQVGQDPDRARPSGVRGLRYDVQQVFLKPAPSQYEILRDLISEPTAAVIVDPGFAGAVLLTGEPRSERPPVIVAGVLPLMLSSTTTPPFGLGLAPLANSKLNRIRNAALRLLVEQVMFGAVQREADRMARQASGRGLPTFLLNWANTADAIAQFSIPSFEYPRPDATVLVRFLGPLTPRTDLPTPAWWTDLQGERPVVLVTQGTIANRDLTELIRPTVEALADQDVLVVVTTGGPPIEALGPLPTNVRAAEYLPYDQLFPHLAVMVTNGGYGGVHYALAHGVPLVVAGGGEDKPEVAARVAWSGVGVNLRTGHPTREVIRRGVHEVLTDNRYKAAAVAAAEQIAASPGVAGLEDLVTQLCSSH